MIDYFKKVVAGLRNIFGGRVSAYETLIERARREALLRMKEEAKLKGAESIFNVKLETASISKNAGGQIGSVEVYAYGTAISKFYLKCVLIFIFSVVKLTFVAWKWFRYRTL